MSRLTTENTSPNTGCTSAAIPTSSRRTQHLKPPFQISRRTRRLLNKLSSQRFLRKWVTASGLRVSEPLGSGTRISRGGPPSSHATARTLCPRAAHLATVDRRPVLQGAPGAIPGGRGEGKAPLAAQGGAAEV